MIKFKRILTKCLAAVLALAILPCVFGTSCSDTPPDNEDVPREHPVSDDKIFESESDTWHDEHIPISVSFDYFGEKIKISEKKYVNVSYTVNDNAESPELNVLVLFANGEHDLSHAYKGFYPHVNRDNVCYIIDHNKELKKFASRCYTQEYIYFYFENGSEEYNDFYSNGCQFDFSVDLRSLAVIESVEASSFASAVLIVPDATSGYFYRDNSNGVFYATDGEYVAFSDVSKEDAIAILTGELPSEEPSVEDPPVEDPPSEEPRGFWDVLNDLFDGCD